MRYVILYLEERTFYAHKVFVNRNAIERFRNNVLNWNICCK